MAMKRITKRWLLNSFGVIVVILVVICLSFVYGIHSYYYNGVRQAINSRASVMADSLVRYYEDASADYRAEVRNLVENFEYKDKMELMAINGAGKVVLTSSGFEPQNPEAMPDYEEACAKEKAAQQIAQEVGGTAYSGTVFGQYIGEMGPEKVMAVTMLSPVKDNEYAALRFVVSLTRVDEQIVELGAVVLLVGLGILCFVSFSSSYFINSIVTPVGEIGQTAQRIAQGDFAVRIEKGKDDEIGDLCDAINNMAVELGASDTMKNDFISSVSHELRTPLTAIKGWGETLQTTTDKETIEKGMGVILKETDRLSGMVEELLDFSRMQSGRLTLLMDKLDIIAELGDAYLMFTQRALREGMEILYDEPEESIPVVGDRNRLRQVFVNVMDNAIKYSDNGAKITISVTHDSEAVHIAISDTGVGIRAEDLPMIKKKFYKGNSTRRGSGIGLAVADEIIRMHAGTLEVASTHGEGTTVTITLPVAGSQHAPIAQRT